MVAARDQRRSRGRAKRRGIKLGVAQTGIGDLIQGGCRNDAAKCSTDAVALVVGDDKEYVRRALGVAPRAAATRVWSFEHPL